MFFASPSSGRTGDFTGLLPLAGGVCRLSQAVCLFASREREPSGQHEFDLLCQRLGIEHRLTQPRTPRTNGMVERFNGRIADVLNTHRFNSQEDLDSTLLRYVALYNHQLPQSALKSLTPLQAMKQWYKSHPHLFLRRPSDRPGCDS